MVLNKGGVVPGPFIFIATNRLKPGKLADERGRVPGLVDFIEANEPRPIAFNEYVNEDGTEVGVVQVHADADSMRLHMEIVAERAAAAYAETVEETTSSGFSARRVTPSSEGLTVRLAPVFRCWSSPTISVDSRAHTLGTR